MGVYRADGTRVTKAAFPATAVTQVPLKINEDLYVTSDYEQRASKLPEGDKKQLLYRAGAVVDQADIDRLFAAATVTAMSPTSGPAAGGTVVTITGTDLDGVNSVTFGGTAGTALTIVSRTEIRVTSPAKVAGAAAVSVADDAGAVAAGNFTYV